MSQETDGAKPKSKFTLYVILGCLGFLVIFVGIWLAVVLPEFMKDSGQPVDTRTAEEIALEKELKEKEAEETATWETYHCDLMHRYYAGPEADVPLAELLGLSFDASVADVKSRCGELLPAVRLMGGWPSDQRPWDNFVICEGFDFVLKDSGNLTIRPTAEDLRNDEVAFGIPGKWFRKQKLVEGYTRKIANFVPLVIKAHESCVIVGMPRAGRMRAIWGRIERTP